jgi:acetylornithine/N-succinyldiaminopimelate aminotransferase
VALTDNPKIIAPVNETENAVILPFNDIQATENVNLKMAMLQQ